MSWFPSSNFASLAKNALKEAQKTIDKALDIKDDASSDGTINTTVSSMADAASDFFSSFGVTTPSKPDKTDDVEPAVPGGRDENSVVTIPPAKVISSMGKSSSTVTVSNEESFPSQDRERETALKRSFTTSDVELIAFEGKPQFTSDGEKSSGDDEKFQSLWLDTSDSFESSVETSSTSTTTVDALEDSLTSAKDFGTGIIHPIAVHSLPLVGNEDDTTQGSSSSTPTPPLQPLLVDVDPPLEGNCENNFHPISLEPESAEEAKEQAKLESMSSSGNLESSTGSVVQNPDLDSNPSLIPLTLPEVLDSETEPISSKISQSSRATSSISVVSEEKDSDSPQVSPSSQHNVAEVRDSPSFEVISIHQQQRNGKSDSNSSFDFLTSSNNCPSHGSSVSVIPSLQSTPERGTPLTHSRSNSNTSSSFDRVEEFNNRAKLPAHHFVSSTSSSDIEVISVDTIEGFHLHRKRGSLVEVETQTSETWPEKVEVKERVVELIPTKTASMLAEKDSEILQLREEGEKLSKKQFELSSAIKKLRQKEKDMDNTVKSLRSDLTVKNGEIERITKLLMAKETQDHAQSETISKLNTESRKQLATIAQLRSDLEDAKENSASMKASLEEASVEILELQNTISSVQRDTTELDKLTRVNGELKTRSESLEREVQQLRESLDSTQHKNASRETDLQNQIHNLTLKVHSLENQLADNSSDIADATMPLSLEIEKLQQLIKSKSEASERKEQSLLAKVSELESKIKNQEENEKSLRRNQVALQNTVLELELENEKLTGDKLVLSSQLKEERAINAQNLHQVSLLPSLEAKINQLNAEISSLRTENETRNSEIRNLRNSLQAETKRNQVLSEQLKLSNSQRNERVSLSSASGIKHEESRDTSPRSEMSEASYLDDVLDPNGQNHCLTPKSFFDSFSSVNYIENLQGHLKQKELELVQLHQEVSKNDKIRRSLNEEIAHLTVNNQELLQKVEKLNGLQQRLAEVETNYNAVLQMYGEKVEEADELRMDLQDVKEMYKVQIEQLLRKAS